GTPIRVLAPPPRPLVAGRTPRPDGRPHAGHRSETEAPDPEDGPMPAHLVSLDGLAPISIDRALIVVGRDYQCDARPDSPSVSKRHCCLFRDGGGLVVRDLGSSNGTRINGHPVVEGRLRTGDELAVARSRFRLEGD